MNTESFRGLRATLPIFDDFVIDQKVLEEAIESLRKVLHSVEQTIKIVGDMLCIE